MSWYLVYRDDEDIQLSSLSNIYKTYATFSGNRNNKTTWTNQSKHSIKEIIIINNKQIKQNYKIRTAKLKLKANRTEIVAKGMELNMDISLYVVSMKVCMIGHIFLLCNSCLSSCMMLCVVCFNVLYLYPI